MVKYEFSHNSIFKKYIQTTFKDISKSEAAGNSKVTGVAALVLGVLVASGVLIKGIGFSFIDFVLNN
ncbi:hypothetical protein MAR_003515 [Mya arenaria]|uniref:Uncharacterized protein n=1 Tax=Mya arenaria TaxID=6604 RepID=A0ABY7G677_MYAAR|nr:hypothetical protein MAR_003515 [Mya arenaria]